jgi:hypothetical protein
MSGFQPVENKQTQKHKLPPRIPGTLKRSWSDIKFKDLPKPVYRIPKPIK